jgi:palmitoyltransferase ZDHHC9/14/18
VKTDEMGNNKLDCPWVGNCVGVRNYRYFYGFLIVACLFTTLCFTCSISELVIRADKNLDIGGGAIALLILSFFCALPSFGLCSMHTFLVLVDSTTYDVHRHNVAFAREEFRVKWKECKASLFGSVIPSAVRQYHIAMKKAKIATVEDTSPNDFKLHGAEGIQMQVV